MSGSTMPRPTQEQIDQAQLAAEYLHGIFTTDGKISEWLTGRGVPLSASSIGTLRRGDGKLSAQMHDVIIHWANVHQNEEDVKKENGTPFKEEPKPLLTHAGVLEHVRKASQNLVRAEQEILLASEEAGLPITSVGFLKLHDQIVNLRKTYLETILGKAQ